MRMHSGSTTTTLLVLLRFKFIQNTAVSLHVSQRYLSSHHRFRELLHDLVLTTCKWKT